MLLVQLGIVHVGVMFGNFAKIGRTACASAIWKNFQTSRVHLIPVPLSRMCSRREHI
jgi:hypothetical protein